MNSHRRKLILSLVLTPLLAVVMQFAEFNGLMAGPEGLGLNVWLRGPGPTSQEIFIVEIRDEDYQRHFGRTSPLPPERVKALLRAVAATRPAVLGVDILTEDAGYDLALDRELRALGTGEVVWIAAPGEVHYEPITFLEWMGGKHPHARMRPGAVLHGAIAETALAGPRSGVPYFPVSEDLRVKLFPRHVATLDHPAGHAAAADSHGAPPEPLTFAQEIYRRYLEQTGRPYAPTGRHADHEVFMNFSGERYRFTKLAAGDFIERTPPEEVSQLLRRKIVLVGGTYAEARDQYETPLGRLPGLEINAFAVQTNLGDGGVGEIARPLALLFDLVFGYLVVFLFNYRVIHHWRALPGWLIRPLESMVRDEVRWKTVWSIVISLAGAFAFSLLMFRAVDLWASYLAVFAGTILHQIIEVIIENPGAGEEPHHAA